MKIKVAYDITFLGKFFSYSDNKVGVYRLTEELLLELLKDQNIDISLTSLCTDTPAFSSVNCQLYYNQFPQKDFCKFINSFKSRFYLNWFYKLCLSTYYSKNFQSLPRYSWQSVLVRGFFKLLKLTSLTDYDNQQIFDSKKYDLIHSTYYKLPPKNLTGNTPRLITIYDLIPIKKPEFVTPPLTLYTQEILKSINPETDWVVCISEYTHQEFCEYTGMHRDRTFVTYLAADKNFYPVTNQEIINNINQKYQIPNTPYFLCLASHLDPRKNIPHLINTFVDLISENPSLDVNLVLIGTTRYKRPDIEKTMQQIAQYKSRIILTGYVLDQDLSAIYSGAIAFVFPSLYEGFGLPILEAMQCGTPVISSNVTSLPEVVGDSGILVEPQNQHQLKKAMLDILTNTSLQESLSQKSIFRAKQFSWEKCANETVEIYKKIIANK
ncbi:glycosyltransferase family 4 protein [Pseudanabaena sp. ABRG5-3]|uniref:glycosyltransferase family 4 protein n=1 Tax=Pseudanabaena sp. ABRG5-3 TaxID=685565 RepID=UPI000DC73963|nr:glycosyltransferase family 1 protein [Pseudanabaena sp. ABRG5-3]BBC22809.1 group 1 glycosyl transferase [Pseudanabaena sp. ABRG5-3]